jgi:alanyl-tRNA synthetase
MKSAEIREIFYSYFMKHNHHRVLSAPLVPAKDPTLLFTNAGMNQFKSVFLNEEKREYNRAVSIQKCMRVSGKHNDFDEVGKSDFHHTFFEMMGNFSFGDYFKEQAIEYGWELLTQHYKFKPEQLWVTVFREDDEAADIWEEKIGVPAEKIVRLDEKDNFWQMGETGPCGPCSEIHFDRGESFGPPTFTDDNKRFIEIWNLVFMEFYKDENGKLNPLPAPSIDTGMGVERLTTLLQGASTNYHTDLFRPIIEYTAELADIDPDTDIEHHRVALNVVADHIRALSFLISDGVLPSNDGRGYVLRRILRRAAKHGKALGFTSTFLHQVSARAVEMMKPFYPELEYNKDFISEVILSEEERFNLTIANGLKRFDELLATALESGLEKKIIPGGELFKLSDTFGFPLDFARDLAMEKDIEIDSHGFQKELEQQREKSRLSLAAKQKAVKALEKIETYSSTFTGYDSLEEEAVVQAIYVDGKAADEINEGMEGLLVLDKTPFYAQSGGQIGDRGIGKNETSFFQITDARKAIGSSNAILHSVSVKKGTLYTGNTVGVTVDAKYRKNVAVHHTSTHLLHAALREVLGLHVKQAGSFVGPDKLRFDFTHFKALSIEELSSVEQLVNRKIRENLPVKTDVLKYEEAIERGAMAIFEEKYTDVVRMLSMGDFSMELCGGTHLDYTGEIGIFKITGESSISSGVRRIEASAGEKGYAFVSENLARFNQIVSHFRQKQDNILAHLVHLENELKDKEKLLKKKQKQEKSSSIDMDTMISEGIEINGVHAIAVFVEGIDRKQLSTLADDIKNKTDGVAVVLTNMNGKSAIVVSIAKALTPKLKAGNIVKDIAALVKGSGGGRPDFAQAGGEPVEDFLKIKPTVTDILKKHLA